MGQALVIGERARGLLGEGAQATVLGCSSRTAFLEVGGEVVWVAGPTGVRHPRAVLASQVPDWRRGSSLTVDRGVLRGEEGDVGLEGAVVWVSPKVPDPSPSLPARARALWASEARHDLFDLGGDWISELSAACPRGLEAVAAWGRGVIGKGPGLTPLGDDLVGGALFAFRVLGETGEPVEGLVAWAQGRTVRLSGCLLKDLAWGIGPEPLHRLGAALAAGEEEAARHWAEVLGGVGRSTGRALLAGALVVWGTVGGGGSRW